ncbi:hypothetical protein Bca101_092092 [Brassica carinata]
MSDDNLRDESRMYEGAKLDHYMRIQGQSTQTSNPHFCISSVFASLPSVDCLQESSCKHTANKVEEKIEKIKSENLQTEDIALWKNKTESYKPSFSSKNT